MRRLVVVLGVKFNVDSFLRTYLAKKRSLLSTTDGNGADDLCLD